MSLVAVITDTHFGARNDSHSFYDYFKKFNDEVFFKTIDDLGIKTVFHLGDVYDRRKYVNFLTAKRAREDFLQPLNDRGLDCHIIIGNHDTTYKNTNDVNSLVELLRGYDSFKIYKDPTEIELDGLPILLLPWICEANHNQTVQMIKYTKATICFGHLSINGFEQNRGQIRDGHDLEDLDKATFTKFDVVASGHFHHQSQVDNIKYLGAAYEFTWADYNDARGFHVFDTETREFTFYQNPYRKFFMVVYDDLNGIDAVQQHIKETDFSYIENGYIKVVVANRNNPYMFDLFIDKLYKAGPTDISLVEDISSFVEIEGSGEIEVEDTPTMINNYIDSLQLNLDNNKMKKLMGKIYQEALVLEEF